MQSTQTKSKWRWKIKGVSQLLLAGSAGLYWAYSCICRQLTEWLGLLGWPHSHVWPSVTIQHASLASSNSSRFQERESPKLQACLTFAAIPLAKARNNTESRSTLGSKYREVKTKQKLHHSCPRMEANESHPCVIHHLRMCDLLLNNRTWKGW